MDAQQPNGICNTAVLFISKFNYKPSASAASEHIRGGKSGTEGIDAHTYTKQTNKQTNRIITIKISVESGGTGTERRRR